MGMKWKSGKSSSVVRGNLEDMRRETKERAHQHLFDEAESMLDLSQAMAPIDEGHLESAHRLETSERANGAHARIWIEPNASTDSDGNAAPGPYLEFIHFGSYKLGPKSQAKDAAQIENVGPLFLQRAYERRRKILEKKLAETLGQIIQRS